MYYIYNHHYCKDCHRPILFFLSLIENYFSFFLVFITVFFFLYILKKSLSFFCFTIFFFISWIRPKDFNPHTSVQLCLFFPLMVICQLQNDDLLLNIVTTCPTNTETSKHIGQIWVLSDFPAVVTLNCLNGNKTKKNHAEVSVKFFIGISSEQMKNEEDVCIMKKFPKYETYQVEVIVSRRYIPILIKSRYIISLPLLFSLSSSSLSSSSPLLSLPLLLFSLFLFSSSLSSSSPLLSLSSFSLLSPLLFFSSLLFLLLSLPLLSLCSILIV
ncbi:unnamed protein product [Acanthosepion pharaonis]|uniref:Uncharacterized protein n=1 Tax=Acanthosepion pharaonis TaxID=158019 RepID=A0A812E9E8_ACAPH|nr:unnamed protein product [Sepia pharaonis]